MEPFQYFDEEYSSHQDSINSLHSLILESHDKISQMLSIQKSLPKSISLDSIQTIIDSATHVLNLSSEILQSVSRIKDEMDYS